MLYVLDEEEVSPLSLSAQEGLRKGHRKMQIRKKQIPMNAEGNDYSLRRANLCEID